VVSSHNPYCVWDRIDGKFYGTKAVLLPCSFYVPCVAFLPCQTLQSAFGESRQEGTREELHRRVRGRSLQQ